MKKIFLIMISMLMIMSLASCTYQSRQKEEAPPVDESWPSQLAPKPEYGTYDENPIITDDVDIYNMEWTLEDAKAYVEQCKETGFTENQVLNEGDGFYDWYSYENASCVQVHWSNTTNYIKVTKRVRP